MPDSLFAIFVALGILLLLALWVPCLHLCHRCVRKVTRRDLPVITIAGVLLFHGMARGQLVAVNTITTVAGNGINGFSGDGGLATSSSIAHPYGLANDTAGNLYIADTQNNRIRKVDTKGIITTIAGTGAAGFSGDGGPATSAAINEPYSIALDAGGNVYFNDQGNLRIRRIDATTGTISTVAGTGASVGNDPFNGEGGPATSANLIPYGIAVDTSGNLYISAISFIRKVTASTGIISTVAGNGTGIFSGDGGPATNAGFNAALITVDAFGNLYLGDRARIRKVALSTGIISTIAGDGINKQTGDGGLATNSEISGEGAVAVDHSGNVYLLCDATIRMINVGTGIINTIVGVQSKYGYSGDGGPAIAAGIDTSNGVTVDLAGNVYFTDQGDAFNSPRVRKSFPLTFPTTAVGSSSTRQTLFLQATTSETIISPLVIPASQGGNQEYTVASTSGCGFNSPIAAGAICSISLIFSPAYPGQRPVPLQINTSAGKVAIGLNALGTGPLASLTPGIMSTIAGTGTRGLAGDGGAATAAQIYSPYASAVDSRGNFYISDYGRIRKIDGTTSIITTIIGASDMSQGYTPDGGLATAAKIGYAYGIVVGSDGSVYYTEPRYGGLVRKIDGATGILTTVAGVYPSGGSTADGGPATSARLIQPVGIAIDSADNLYIADYGDYRIRKVTASSGIITTVAGNATSGNTGDGGLATTATLSYPVGIAVDPTGNLYISFSTANTIRKVTASTGIITLFAGNGTGGFDTGDGGPAVSAGLNATQSLATDAAGDLYFLDSATGDDVVREVKAATGTVSRVAGNGNNFSDGVPANLAAFSSGRPFSLDAAGNLYVFDSTYFKVRKIAVGSSALIYPTATLVGSLDTTDDPQTFTLSNSGNANLQVPLGGPVGDPVISPAWTVDPASTCPNLSASGYNLIAGSDCTFAVDFTPTVSGANTGSLNLTDNSLNIVTSAQTVALSGQGIASTTSPAITLSTTSLTFPDTQIGNISNSLAITVSNTGTATANITGITIVGADPTSFIQANNCVMTLASGSNCTINVTFTPTAANRSFNATLTVASNDPNSPATATLTGKGLAAPVGAITLTPSAVTFTTTAGVTAPSQTVMLTNTGTAQVTLGTSPITITGTSPSAFQGSAGMCGYTLAVGASCNASVSFILNTTTGTYTAAFNATYYATSTTMAIASIPLTGTVTAAPAAQAVLTPAIYNFGNVTTGMSAPSQTFTLTNAGAATLSITSVALNGTNAASFSMPSKTCGSSLAAGNSCTITVNFTPTAAGANVATLTVVDAVGTQTSNLTGTGVASVVAADFMLTATPATQSTYRGHSVTYSVQVASTVTSNPFTNAVTLAVTGLPSGTTATLTPASITPGATGGISTLTVTVTGLTAANVPASRPGQTHQGPARDLGIALACLAAPTLLLRRRKQMPRLLAVALFLGMGALVASTTGCGDGAGFAVPASTSTLTITGTSGATTHSTTVTLTIQ